MQTQAKRENRSNCPANRARTGVCRVGQCPAKEKKRRMSLAEKTATICILTIAALAALTGCQSPTGEVFPATSTGHKPGILATGDTNKVAFTSVPELSQSKNSTGWESQPTPQIVDLSGVLKGMPTPVMYVSPGDVIYVRPKFISF
jgi:hypothetical protein